MAATLAARCLGDRGAIGSGGAAGRCPKRVISRRVRPRVARRAAGGAAGAGACSDTEADGECTEVDLVPPRGDRDLTLQQAIELAAASVIEEEVAARRRKAAPTLGGEAEARSLPEDPVEVQAVQISKTLASGAAAGAVLSAAPSLFSRLRLPLVVAVWYGSYLAFNLVSKATLAAWPAPGPLALHALYQLAAAGISAALVAARCEGGPRELSRLLAADAGRGWRQSAASALSHGAALTAIGGASLCFAHTVKAAEPLFAAALGASVFGKRVTSMQWLTIVPVIAGVSYSSMSQGAAFAWSPLLSALACVATLAYHNASVKLSLSPPETDGNGDEAMLAARTAPVVGAPLRMYARVALRASVLSVIGALLLGGGPSALAASAAQAAAVLGGADVLAWRVAVGGVTFASYNLMALVALGELSALSSSVGNVAKRVVVVVASCVLFGTPVSARQALGFGVAMAGVLAYSLASIQAGKAHESQAQQAEPALAG